MIRPQLVAEEMERIDVLGNLTDVFQSIASLQIARTKRQVQASQGFFSELWRLYTELRVESGENFGHESSVTTTRQLYVVVTAEGGFSGDIDRKLINWMLTQYDATNTDIICMGHHGAVQLAQAGVAVMQYFKLPVEDQHLNLVPMIDLIQRYPSTTVFYQTYVSLSVQDVKRISLQRAVRQLSSEVESGEVISRSNYILEPSDEEVITYLESTMLSIALAQVILESKLAQYASRFRAMSAAHTKAVEISGDLKLDYYRAKRSQADERLKEITSGLRHLRGTRSRS